MFRRLVLVVLLALAACGKQADETPPPEPPFTDGLRKVAMSSGFRLSFVPAETGSQVLCQALPYARWQQLLGAPVRRVPEDKGGRRCAITAGDVRVDLSLFELLDPPTDTIAGRPAAVRTDDGTQVEVGIADQVNDEISVLQHHVLILRTSGDVAFARKVLADLVPVLAKGPGPDVDLLDGGPYFTFTPTPFTHDEFVDQPTYAQAAQICTLLQDRFAYRATHLDITGSCEANSPTGTSMIVGTNFLAPPPESYPSRIAGRPATTTSGLTFVRLRDGIALDLSTTSDTDPGVFEKLVAALA